LETHIFLLGDDVAVPVRLGKDEEATRQTPDENLPCSPRVLPFVSACESVLARGVFSSSCEL